MQKPKNVLIALEMNEASARKQLAGILRYLGASRHWSIRLMQCAKNLTSETAKALSTNHFDGLLTGINASDADEDTRQLLSTYPIPAAFMDAEPHRSTAAKSSSRAFIRIDNADVGRCAARHLVSLGNFRSFGFVPEKTNPHWSSMRESAFCSELKRKGKSYRSFESTTVEEPRYRKELTDWLLTLPKPAAVFCAWDESAVTVATICTECQISVPEQISILGVDDDEFLCNLVSPPLSSIRPDFEGEGFLAAKTLDMMMSRKNTIRLRSTVCKVDGITERGSTRPLSPSGFLVQRALDYIDRNVCNGISVPDVVAHLGVSRSLLSLRFRQIQKKSILETIRDRRMQEVKRLLENTTYPISRIVSTCGFKSENSPKNLFRKMFGMTMFEYRKRNFGKSTRK